MQAIERLTSRVNTSRFTTWGAAGFLALGLATQLKFRSRDPLLSAVGVVDIQVAVELLAWALGGLWVAVAVARSGRNSVLNRPRLLSRPLQMLGLFALVVAASSLYSPVPVVSLVRAVQWLILFGLATVLYGRFRVSSPDRDAFWINMRRVFWAVLVLSAIATLVVPIWSPLATGFRGDARFRFFDMHPVQAATLAGLGVITVASSYLGVRDPLFDRRAGRFVRLVLLVVLVALLGATRTRGALTGALVGSIVMLWFHKRRAARLALIGVMATLALLFTGVGSQTLTDFLARGQSTEQLLTLSGRTNLASEAWPLIWEKLFLGHGYLAARVEFLNLAWGAGESHNLLLEVLFSTGLVGLTVLAMLVASIAGAQRRALREGSSSNRSAAIDSIGLLVFLLVMGIIGDGFAGPPGMETLALATCVLLLTQQQPEHTTRAGDPLSPGNL